MKKGIISTVLVAMLTLGIVTGCTVDQAKDVAHVSGLVSAVSWTATAPTTNEIAAVELVLVVIETKAADVEGGATYTEVIYPEVVKLIDKDVEPKYRPAAMAGSLLLLTGLDRLFAANPEWKLKQTDAIQIVDAFIVGAKEGLALMPDDPMIIAEKEQLAAQESAQIARISAAYMEVKVSAKASK